MAWEAPMAAERTPQDYAIEHAGYMAQAARNLMAKLNAEDYARVRHEESDTDETRDDLSDAGEERADAFNALQSSIYEFEKRRDRAAGVKEVPRADD